MLLNEKWTSSMESSKMLTKEEDVRLRQAALELAVDYCQLEGMRSLDIIPLAKEFYTWLKGESDDQ